MHFFVISRNFQEFGRKRCFTSVIEMNFQTRSIYQQKDSCWISVSASSCERVLLEKRHKQRFLVFPVLQLERAGKQKTSGAQTGQRQNVQPGLGLLIDRAIS